MHLTRGQVRHLGALASAAMAAIYFLIGLRVLDIGGSTSGETVDLALFGFSAGTAFLLLAVSLLSTDRRWMWVLAAMLQLWVYVIYLSVSGTREPPFEMWGITLRIIQLPLLVVLVYLSWKAPPPHPAGAAR
jgi:peptidoglycan/LPS O-acetylase OafA/YrhL